MAVRNFKVGDLEVSKQMIDVAQELVITGSVSEACRNLDVPTGTVWTWFRTRPDFNKLVQVFTDTLIEELKITVVNAARDAITVEREIMLDQKNDPKIRLSAAQDIINRVPNLSPKALSQPAPVVSNVVNYFSEVADKAIDEIIEIENLQKKYEVVEVDVERPFDGERDSISEDGEDSSGRI